MKLILDNVTQGRSISWICRTENDDMFIIDKLPGQTFRVNVTELINTKFPTLEKALFAIEELYE